MKTINFILIGCFGSDPFDKSMEMDLDRHLNSREEFICTNCDYEGTQGEFEDNGMYCPECDEFNGYEVPEWD